jgi:hypothetical protein
VNARYQEWLKHIFDHEVRGHLLPQWYWDEDAPLFEAPDEEIVELIGHTFRNAGQDLAKYSDAQVDQGIWYFVSVSGSNFMHLLESPGVPLPERLEAIQSIFHLYADCFAKRCVETLGYLSEEGSPLNPSCYMFWDISPLTVVEAKEIQDAVLKVLEKILTIEHRACRESALHGLGEMFFARQEAVQAIIDRFLGRKKLDEKLLAYARTARQGNVL